MEYSSEAYNSHELSQQLIYYMNRQKELLIELERREGDAANLKDLALAYEDLEVERNNLQAELEELSRSERPRNNMGQSTDREVYQKRIFEIVHQLNIKSKEYSELEGEFKHLQQQNISLNETIQHYEEFVGSLRNEMKNFKASAEDKQHEINSLKQQLGFLRERGTGEFNEDREVILMKLQQIITERQQEINVLKNNLRSIGESYQNYNVESGTYEAVIADLRSKEGLILNLERKIQFLSEESRTNNLTLESKNQQIFRIKKQLLDSENKWAVTSEANLNSSKPRTAIDYSLNRELEVLKSLRPELEVTKQTIRRKQLQILELRQSKQAEIFKLSNQIQQLQMKLSSSNNKLEQQRLHYRQWKLSSDNRLIKQSIKPVSNTVSIISTYEKEIKDLYDKLQQSRQDYIQMRRTSEEKVTNLEMKTNELVFRMNELNSQLWNSSQEIEVLVKENKGARTTINNLKIVNQETHTRVSQLTYELNVFKSKKGKSNSNSNSEARLQALKNNIENLLENEENGFEKQRKQQETEEIIGIKNQNRELHRMIENRQVQINHLEAALVDLNASLQEYKGKYQQLQAMGRHQQEVFGSNELQSHIQLLQEENQKLKQQKQMVFNEITATQNTINLLTIKLEKLQYSNCQYDQVWANIDGLYVSANKLGVLIMVLKDEQGNDDTVKKLTTISAKIKADIDRIIGLKEKIQIQ